jgi:hypothetical protein
MLGWNALELQQLAQPVADPGPPHRQLGADQLPDPGTDLVHARYAQRHGHAGVGAEEVDRHRHGTAGRPLEEQRRPVAAHGTGDDLADLQRRVDRYAHPVQLPGALERVEELLQVAVREARRRHGDQSRRRSPAARSGPE